MMENRAMSDWNGINSEIENEKTAQSNNDRSGLADGSSEAKIIKGTKAPKVGSQNPPDSTIRPAAPDSPAPETVSGWWGIIPTMSLDEAASALRNDLFSGSQGWGALRSPVLDVITGKSCFSIGSALVSGIVGNCIIDPFPIGRDIEEKYWKPVRDGLTELKKTDSETFNKAAEYSSNRYDQAKTQIGSLIKNFQGIDFVFSAFGADMGFPIYTTDKKWMKGSPPVVNFSSTLTGIGLSLNFAKDNIPVTKNNSGVDTNQIYGSISPNVSFLRYFGISFNRDYSQGSLTVGLSVAIPVANISTTSDNLIKGVSYHGTNVGKSLDKINDRFVKQVEQMLYGK